MLKSNKETDLIVHDLNRPHHRSTQLWRMTPTNRQCLTYLDVRADKIHLSSCLRQVQIMLGELKNGLHMTGSMGGNLNISHSHSQVNIQLGVAGIIYDQKLLEIKKKTAKLKPVGRTFGTFNFGHCSVYSTVISVIVRLKPLGWTFNNCGH